ncbi:hypothetical protein GCU56_08300 [Geodermatophilus sabuli]|uniref:Uncharacterized protein n=1 Tax=Geodermatophilus sabuli TaxID=1564158 RepID=A0A7K3VZ02_9ACTN|nr:hypothetical protein [Geodermatophilus sabuli]NEK57871.1 hypothetical protein [Geodermatophilus sabuli]
MERAMWAGPATVVLVVGGMAVLLFALVLPETRPSGLVFGTGLVLVGAVLDLCARVGRRRGALLGSVGLSR